MNDAGDRGHQKTIENNFIGPFRNQTFLNFKSQSTQNYRDRARARENYYFKLRII